MPDGLPTAANAPYWSPSSRDNQDPRQAEEFLDELEFLAETADIAIGEALHPAAAAALVAHLRRVRANWRRSPATARSTEIDVVIFDDELLTVADAQHREGDALPPAGPHAPDPRHLHVAGPRRPMPRRRCSWPITNTCCPGLSGHVDPPRTAAGRHGNPRRRRRARNRDRPPHHPQPHRQTEGGPARRSTARWPCSARTAVCDGPRGAGGLYQRRANRR